MFILARAATYATLFIGLLLIFLPGRVLSLPGCLGIGIVFGLLHRPDATYR